MVIPRALAILASIGLAGCNGFGAEQARLGPAQSTGVPYTVDTGEVETPNSLPPGFTTDNAMAPSTGVVGVLHMPP